MSRYKILLIGAHPDDPDLCGGGLAALHLAHGNEVKFISLTDGCRGHHEMTMEQTRARRYGETQALAAKAGLTYDVWDVPDGELFPTLEPEWYEYAKRAALLGEQVVADRKSVV